MGNIFRQASLLTIKWFQVLLFNTKNSIQLHSFVCTVKWFQILKKI